MLVHSAVLQPKPSTRPKHQFHDLTPYGPGYLQCGTCKLLVSASVFEFAQEAVAADRRDTRIWTDYAGYLPVKESK